MRWRMSAFGGKADSDQPLLTNLDLWVHGLVQSRHLLHGRCARVSRRRRFRLDKDDGDIAHTVNSSP